MSVLVVGVGEEVVGGAKEAADGAVAAAPEATAVAAVVVAAIAAGPAREVGTAAAAVQPRVEEVHSPGEGPWRRGECTASAGRADCAEGAVGPPRCRSLTQHGLGLVQVGRERGRAVDGVSPPSAAAAWKGEGGGPGQGVVGASVRRQAVGRHLEEVERRGVDCRRPGEGAGSDPGRRRRLPVAHQEGVPGRQQPHSRVDGRGTHEAAGARVDVGRENVGSGGGGGGRAVCGRSNFGRPGCDGSVGGPRAAGAVGSLWGLSVGGGSTGGSSILLRLLLLLLLLLEDVGGRVDAPPAVGRRRRGRRRGVWDGEDGEAAGLACKGGGNTHTRLKEGSLAWER